MNGRLPGIRPEGWGPTRGSVSRMTPALVFGVSPQQVVGRLSEERSALGVFLSRGERDARKRAGVSLPLVLRVGPHPGAGP